MLLDKLKIIEHGGNKTVSVPVDSWMNDQITTVHNFMIENVIIPVDVEGKDGVAPFKPLMLMSSLFIMVSKFCQFVFYDEENKRYNMFNPSQFVLGKGLYAFTIEMPYVYMAKHKHGHRASLSMIITQVEYTPEVLPLQVISTTPQQPSVPEPKPTKGPTKQRVRKNKNALKLDLSMCGLPASAY